MTQPEVSVIMSVYNGEKHLRNAINSILNQDFINFEFIIIDDGSTDRSLEIIQSIQDPRIRIIQNKRNIGLAASLNKGIKQAAGKYIARMDADDTSEIARLKEQVKFLNRHNDIYLVGTHTFLIDKNGRVFNTWKPATHHNDIVKTMQKGNSFCHGSVMLKREVSHTVGTYRENFRYAQDYDFWLRISEYYKTANIDKLLYRNRRTADTASRSSLSQQLDFHLLARELAKERRQTGLDSLSIVRIETLEEELSSRFGLSKAGINQFKSTFFFRKFIEAFKTHDYLQGFNFWLNGLLMAPDIYAQWSLLKNTGELVLNRR